MSAKSHTEAAVIALRQKIIGGAFRGGERLYEVALAEALNISRTPVRAALSKLAEEGLLDRSKSGGFQVRRFEIADVLDTISLRGILEGTAVRFAAERGVTEEEAVEAEAILTALDQVIDTKKIDMSAYSRENEALHGLFATMSKSAVIIRELQRVTALPFAAPSALTEDQAKQSRLHDHLFAAQCEHRAIVAAILNREGARAEALAREHAQTARRNAEALVTREPVRRGASLAIVSV